MTDLRVRDLYVYPLKSGAGLRVEAVTLDARGFAGDRRWMLIDAAGRFLTQRDLPRLALLRAAFADGGDCVSGPLRLDAPGLPPLVVPEPSPDGVAPAARVTIWDDACEALEGDPDSARPWLREFLGIDARLVFAPPAMPRLVDRNFADGDEHVAFTDGFPLLLIGQASLDGLNARLAAKGSPPLPMNRFRPNIVIDGADPHAEDGWRRIAVGDGAAPADTAGTAGTARKVQTAIPLDIVKPCARCVITTIEQTTAVAGKEPLTTLASYRRRDGKVFFGQSVIHRGTGILRVGDPVRIIEETTT